MIRCARVGLAALIVATLTAWMVLAVWFDGPSSRELAAVLASLVLLVTLVLFLRVRPMARALALFAIGFAGVLAWWLAIPPSNDRPWQADVARPAYAEIDGDRMTLHNVRDFEYRTESDYTPRWEDRTYRLSDIRAMDIFVSYWGPRAIAHTIMSWDFGHGEHLAISIETRKEIGESYSSLRGFFRTYELYYVVADERDLVRLRTNYRGETVYLYRFQMSADLARRFFLDYVERINHLAAEPEWYNAFTQNCTTTIRQHARHVSVVQAWDWRLLANGYADELQYERGNFDRSLPFAEFRARSEITERAKTADPAEFSRVIRAGLPGFPPEGD